MTELEKQFTKDMWNICEQARIHCKPYNPTYFRNMLTDSQYNNNGVLVAKRLLTSVNAQEGLASLNWHNRLDLSVEFHVIKSEYAELFTEDEKSAAMRRLRECNRNFLQFYIK